jgi:hypothetical protein
MSWFRRATPLATRMVYGQQAKNSCGIASVIMVNYLVKKAGLSPYLEANRLSGAYDDTYRSERDVDAAYSQVAGFTYNGTQDTNTELLTAVLNKLNIGQWRQLSISSNDISNKISNSCVGPRRVPIILLVNWRSGGGHFVVCDAAAQSEIGVRADFCDPWDASFHTLNIRRGEPLTYSTQKEAATSAHHYYDEAKKADFSGWAICRVDASAVQNLPASHMPVNRAAPGATSAMRPGRSRQFG